MRHTAFRNFKTIDSKKIPVLKCEKYFKKCILESLINGDSYLIHPNILQIVLQSTYSIIQ